MRCGRHYRHDRPDFQELGTLGKAKRIGFYLFIVCFVCLGLVGFLGGFVHSLLMIVRPPLLSEKTAMGLLGVVCVALIIYTNILLLKY